MDVFFLNLFIIKFPFFFSQCCYVPPSRSCWNTVQWYVTQVQFSLFLTLSLSGPPCLYFLSQLFFLFSEILYWYSWFSDSECCWLYDPLSCHTTRFNQYFSFWSNTCKTNNIQPMTSASTVFYLVLIIKY